MAGALTAAYTLLILSLGLCGLRVLFYTLSYLLTSRRPSGVPATPRTDRPVVTVQLPIYNEPLVAERVIDAACRLRWPRDRLQVQVLDDSRDCTISIVDGAVARWRARGVDIQVCRRPSREGYKAGALAAGLRSARGSVLAVFDADFLPPADFLERTVPHLVDKVAAVQARWGHLNADQTLVTRIQALALDGYFVVEQTVRARLGLFVNFNGSAGVWQRQAIVAAGGWQGDSLAEDTDLSFRAQLAGWRIVFLPEVVIPAELPATLAAFRRQQRRWAIGTTQLLLKLGSRILRSPLPLAVRLHAWLTLAGHLLHLLPIGCLLASPLILGHPPTFPPVLGVLAVLGLAPPAMYAVAQAHLYGDWRRRMAVYPALALVALGLSLNGSLAVLRALAGLGAEFERTPKLGQSGLGDAAADGAAVHRWNESGGAGPLRPAAWAAARRDQGTSLGPRRAASLLVGEAVLASYAFGVLGLAVLSGRWGWTPLLALFAAAFTFTVWLSLLPWPASAAGGASGARRVAVASPAGGSPRPQRATGASAWPAARRSASARLALAVVDRRARRGASRGPR